MKKTVEQVDAEIAALEALKPLSKRYSAFGDDNHAAIDIQIAALKKRWSYDDVNDIVNDSALHNDATDAVAWRLGELEDVESLAKEYAHLK